MNRHRLPLYYSMKYYNGRKDINLPIVDFHNRIHKVTTTDHQSGTGTREAAEYFFSEFRNAEMGLCKSVTAFWI